MIAGKRLYHIGNTRFLVYDGERDGTAIGHIEDEITGFVSDSQPADLFLKQGYWQAYDRGQMIDMPPSPPADIQQVESPASLDSWLRSRQPATRDSFADWQPGMTSPWDPSGFPGKEVAPPPVSIQDRAELAYNAGFRGEQLVTMVAISMAENQPGDPWAMGPYDKTYNTGKSEGKWQRALGLWQIRPLTNPDDPSWVKSDGWRRFADLLDPQTNADAAMLAFDQKGFDAWTTYTGKLHEPYLPQARAAVREMGLM